jgi:hypothetical protein
MFWEDFGQSNKICALYFSQKDKMRIPRIYDFAKETETTQYDVSPEGFYMTGPVYYRVESTPWLGFRIDKNRPITHITGLDRELAFPIPNGLTGSQRVLISTPSLVAFTPAFPSTADSSKVYLYNRVTGISSAVSFQGSQTLPRYFSNWLCATVFEKKEARSPGYSRREAYFKQHAISPQDQYKMWGMSFRDYMCTRTGDWIDYRLLADSVYSPGIIFAYNAETKQSIELNTGEGDSEILLIQDGIMYWREFDEIYQAPITDKGLGQKTLVVKGPPVPDIHWMFISKEGDGK